MNKAEFDSTGTTFFMNQVNITNFNTTFEFKEMPKTNSTGDGIAFVVQNAQQMRTSNDYGDSMLKLAPTPGQMTVLDSFTPSDQKHQALLDLDFGTSGTTIIPTSPGSGVPAASVTLAKNGQIFVVDPNNMGGLSNPAQTFFINSPPNSRTIGAGQWGSPLYFNNRLYLHAEDDLLKSYQIVPGPNGVPVLNPTPIVQQGPTVYFPGTNPTASANGTQNGIIWDLNLSNFDHSGPAVLNAYDANTLTPLYASSSRRSIRPGRPSSSPRQSWPADRSSCRRPESWMSTASSETPPTARLPEVPASSTPSVDAEPAIDTRYPDGGSVLSGADAPFFLPARGMETKKVGRGAARRRLPFRPAIRHADRINPAADRW